MYKVVAANFHLLKCADPKMFTPVLKSQFLEVGYWTNNTSSVYTLDFTENCCFSSGLFSLLKRVVIPVLNKVLTYVHMCLTSDVILQSQRLVLFFILS